jgi:hypothetical protein
MFKHKLLSAPSISTHFIFIHHKSQSGPNHSSKDMGKIGDVIPDEQTIIKLLPDIDNRNEDKRKRNRSFLNTGEGG